MAHEITSSLFGLDPTMFQAQRAAADEAKAFQMAQLDPNQISMAAGLTRANSFGRGVGSLLGVEDPELAANNKLLAIKKQFIQSGGDPRTPEGMAQFAQMLGEQGLTEQAMKAQEKALAMAKTTADIGEKQADIKLKEAQTLKAGREGRSPQAVLIGEIKAAMAKGDVETAETLKGALKTGNTEVVEIGVPGDDKLRQKVVIDKATGEPIAKVGAPYRQGALVENNVNTGGEKKFGEKMGEKDAEKVVSLEDKQLGIRSQFDRLDNLEKLYGKGNLIKGSLPETRLAVAQFFDTFGVKGSENLRGKIKDSVEFQAGAGDMVIEMVKALGSNPSEGDRKFAERIKPSLAQGEGIPEVINYLRKRQQEEAAKNREEIDRVNARNNRPKEVSAEYEEAYKAQETYKRDPAGTLQKAWLANPQVHGKMSMEEFAQQYVRALDKKTRKHI